VQHRIHAGSAILAPGFVDLDALSDLDTTILGLGNQPAWRKGRVWPRSYVKAGPFDMYSPEQFAFQKRHAFATLVRNGITSALPIASLFYREWGETVAEFTAAAKQLRSSACVSGSAPPIAPGTWRWKTTAPSPRLSTNPAACANWRTPSASAVTWRGAPGA
jgi:cytosine/adenosine deaminase-related metal-dependent hydrolase